MGSPFVWFSDCGRFRLSARQKVFADLWLARGLVDAKACAVEAGYSAGGVGTLTRHAGVREYVSVMRPRYEAKALVTQEYVISKLMELVDKSKNDNARVGALRQLGQHLGMWVERTEVSGVGGGPVGIESRDLSGLSDEDLRKVKSVLAGAGKVVN